MDNELESRIYEMILREGPRLIAVVVAVAAVILTLPVITLYLMMRGA